MKLFSMIRAAVGVAGLGLVSSGAVAGGLTGPSCTAPLRALFAQDNIYELEASGSTIFALTSQDGVLAIDVSDPLNPVELDRYPLRPEFMELDGDLLYGLNRPTGLPATVVILDVSDPSDITLVAEHPVVGTADPIPAAFLGMDINDSIGYFTFIANSVNGIGSGFSVVDLSDPMNPVHIGHRFFRGTDEYFGMASSVGFGSHAYVYGFHPTIGQGIHIFDHSDPALPAVGFVPNGSFRLNIHDSMLFVNGVSAQVYDLVDPAAPSLISEFPNVGSSTSVSFFGDDAFVNTSNDGIRRYDFSDPANPQFLIAYETFDRVSDSVTDGSVIYGANFVSGLEVALIDDCELECSADLNSDGAVNFLDISSFLILFVDQDLIVDLNDDGSLNFMDVTLFLDAYGVGC